MDFSALKALRPLPPQLTRGDRKVQSLLRDLEKIKTSKRFHKQLKRSDALIHNVVQILRKADSDALLYTTSIWILVILFRLIPDNIKEIMLTAGVPGVLHNILQSGTLTGSMRQYTSELCFFLSSSQPFPDPKEVPRTGPVQLPEVSAGRRMQKQQLYGDDFCLSNRSEVSSGVDETRLRRRPFVPFRIDEDKLSKIDSLFTHGYQHELAASLPNTAIMSKFGFDQDSNFMLLSDSDDDDDDDSEGGDEDGDGDASVNSTLSSGTPSLSLSLVAENHSLAYSGYTKSSVMRNPSAMAASSDNPADMAAFDFKVFSPTDSSSDRYRPPPSSSSYPSRSIAAEKHREGDDEDFPAAAPSSSSSASSRPIIVVSSPPVRSRASHFRLGGHILRHHHPSHEDSNTAPAHTTHRAEDRLPLHLDDGSIYTGAHMYSRSASMPRAKNDFIAHAASHSITAGSLDPKLSDLVHPSSSFDNYSYKPPTTAPVGTSHYNRSSPSEQAKGRSIADLLAHLDPLSSNVSSGFRAKQFLSKKKKNDTVQVVEENSWMSDDDEEEEAADQTGAYESFDDQTGETDAGFFNSHLNEPGGSRLNPHLHRKMMRIRAEKLIDHSFTKKLFSKKASTSQVQDLIRRMESVLQLMDKDDSGFVTWECFARLILAVAPSHLLRADVLAFMSAQTDNDQNLIDYKEFIISGKVMIIDKQKTKKDNLPVMGWLNRQKVYSGEASTYTWQNHVKWYQARKSRAVVWLMRRATRSMKHAERFLQAQAYLIVQRKKALALTYLLDVGFVAIHSQDNWIDAKRQLLKRMMHARKWSQVVDTAFNWLRNTANVILAQLKLEQNLNDMQDGIKTANAGSTSAVSFESMPRKKQADYGSIYKVYQYYALAAAYLRKKASEADSHCTRQLQVQTYLREYAQRSLMHQMFVELAGNYLRAMGERAYRYCIYRDECMKHLYRVGQHAYQYLVSQQEAIPWLMDRAAAAIVFSSKKGAVAEQLRNEGLFTLRYLNQREVAYASLVARLRRAEALIVRKKEAVQFLKTKPLGLWNHEDRRQSVELSLEATGRNALLHVQRRQSCYLSLKHLADKASVTARRRSMACADLQEIGQEAKIRRFEMHCKIHPPFAAKVRKEMLLLVAADRKISSDRHAMEKTQRWEVELRDAFDFISQSITPASLHDSQDKLIGRIGFNKLLIGGKLLGISKELVSEFFKNCDFSSTSFIPFDLVWLWFANRAKEYERAVNKSLKFTVVDILSAYERALSNQLTRVNSEKVEIYSDFDWDAFYEARKKAAEDMNSSSDEEEQLDEEELDEDKLFADLNYLKNADIGRLMRYLTKQRQQRDERSIDSQNVAGNR